MKLNQHNQLNPHNPPELKKVEDLIMSREINQTTIPTQPTQRTSDYCPIGKQVGGLHYQDSGMQPVEYIVQADLNFNQGNVVKYISRHLNKNGIEDIKKVIHYALIEAYYSYSAIEFNHLVDWLREEIKNQNAVQQNFVVVGSNHNEIKNQSIEPQEFVVRDNFEECLK